VDSQFHHVLEYLRSFPKTQAKRDFVKSYNDFNTEESLNIPED